MALRRCREADISSNARLKLYPDMSILQVANENLFRESGWESVGNHARGYSVPKKGEAKNPQRALESSMHRAKAAIRDIGMCNRFQYFFTGTLSPDVVNRHDADAVNRKVSNFLRNSVYRKNFQYLIVPEPHQNGAIHFHGLCNLGTMKLARAVNPHTNQELSTNRDQPIYNLLDWKLGFSTCIPIDENYQRTCNYITKYITKDSQKIFGKWYLSSRNIQKRPELVLLDNIDYDSFVASNRDAFQIPIYRDIRICQKQMLNTSGDVVSIPVFL